MYTDAGEDVGISLSEGDGAFGILDRGAGGNDRRHARIGGPLQHAVHFGRIMLLDMRMDVDQHPAGSVSICGIRFVVQNRLHRFRSLIRPFFEQLPIAVVSAGRNPQNTFDAPHPPRKVSE